MFKFRHPRQPSLGPERGAGEGRNRVGRAKRALPGFPLQDGPNETRVKCISSPGGIRRVNREGRHMDDLIRVTRPRPFSTARHHGQPCTCIREAPQPILTIRSS